MSPSKRKSRHQDVVTYSDSDEYSEKEHSRSSKMHRKKHKAPKEHEKNSSKHKSQKDNKEKDHKRKERNREDRLSDSEDLKDYRNERDRRLSDDYSKDYQLEKRNRSQRFSNKEYSKKQREDNSYSKKLPKDSADNRKEQSSKHFSGGENYRELPRRKNNRDYENDSPEYRKKRENYEKRLVAGESQSDRRKTEKINKERFSVDNSDYQHEEYKKSHRERYANNEASKDEETKEQNDAGKVDDVEPLSKRQKIVNINMRTGGAYIPPARLRMMQEQIKDKSSEQYQRIAWEALKKSIVGMTNKINGSNIAEIVPELLRENIIRGRGILARAIMQAQAASPTFTRVYAALVAIINTKFPEIGELLLKRLIMQYKRGFRRNDKVICMSAARFLAHLLNQEVAHEVLILEMVTHLLENPTEDSVEVAIACLKECGKKLTQLTARGMRAITQRVRDVLHEGNVDVRVRYMIEVFFAIQKDGFKDFEVIPQELDLVEEDDKYTHLINLDDAVDAQEMLNIFKFDPDYVENEEKYKSVVKEILGEGSDEEGSGNESDAEEEDGEDEEKNDESQQIIDMTETNVVCLRRKIYLTVQSSLDFEECAHKLLKLELKPGQIIEMCYMILDCCAQQRTYEKFFGLLAQRFCQLSKIYVEPFTEIFQNSYKTIHRLETNKLRNVAKFFAHLLYTDAISWLVLANIKLNEEDTTSSSRIFIKILFQELCEYMGLPKLNERVKDITLQEAFEGLFPRDHPHNTRFAINFFTSIGLGGLTDELREHLKNMPKTTAPVVQTEESPEEELASSSSSSSSSSSKSSSSSSSSSSSDSDEKRSKRRKRRRK